MENSQIQPCYWILVFPFHTTATMRLVLSFSFALVPVCKRNGYYTNQMVLLASYTYIPILSGTSLFD